jgi:photosystem II stability/assembly factor-like uncharacterized protein
MRFYALLIVTAQSLQAADWAIQKIDTAADFRGVWAVDANTAWVSGTRGTVGVTTDGGATWKVVAVPGAEKLDFRDVKAFSAATAYAMAAGTGELSRIFKTTDGGATWKLQFRNDHAQAFFNGMAFWDETHGLAMSDPIDGRFRLIHTEDGVNWKLLTPDTMPDALPGEGAYAASGTCVVTRGKAEAFFLTGGATAGRVFITKDAGRTWTANSTPLLSTTDSSGAFAIAFKDDTTAMVVGGDYRKPVATAGTLAVTVNGGQSWRAITDKLPFRSGLAYASNRWIAVGSSGSDASVDDGRSWAAVDQRMWNAVRTSADGTTWAVGPKGLIGKLKP